MMGEVIKVEEIQGYPERVSTVMDAVDTEPTPHGLPRVEVGGESGRDASSCNPTSEASTTTEMCGTTPADLNFICPVCTITFASEVRFQQHVQQSHYGIAASLPVPGFPLDQLSATLMLLSQLHNKNCSTEPAVTQSEEKPYACTQCPATFVHVGHFERHLRLHTDEKTFACDQCAKRFAYSSHLKEHIKMHTGVKPYACSECPATFARTGDLEKHLRAHSSMGKRVDSAGYEKIIQCSHCPASFAHKCNLERHMRAHTGEKPYACDECPRRFSYSNHLTEHKRVHTGEKPYKCGECTATFRTSTELRQHNMAHTGEKPYKCNDCPKAFAHSSHLKQHQMIHRGEKPFECELCPAAFVSRRYLVRHRKKHVDSIGSVEPGPSGSGQNIEDAATTSTSESMNTSKCVVVEQQPVTYYGQVLNALGQSQ